MRLSHSIAIILGTMWLAQCSKKKEQPKDVPSEKSSESGSVALPDGDSFKIADVTPDDEGSSSGAGLALSASDDDVPEYVLDADEDDDDVIGSTFSSLLSDDDPLALAAKKTPNKPDPKPKKPLVAKPNQKPVATAGKTGTVTSKAGQPLRVAVSKSPKGKTQVAVTKVTGPTKGRRLIWRDEFDGDNINSDKWYDYFLPQWGAGGDCNKAKYVVSGGTLKLQAFRDRHPGCEADQNGIDMHSGIMTGNVTGPAGTKLGLHEYGVCRGEANCVVNPQFQNINVKKFAFKYGYAEARVKGCYGGSCAFWMVEYETNPKFSGEVDIYENSFTKFDNGSHCFHFGVHPWDNPSLTSKSHFFFGDDCTMYTNDFHTFGMDWRATGVTLYVDGKKIKTLKDSPNHEMVMILQVSGGSGVPNMPASITNQYEVDYVRVYK